MRRFRIPANPLWPLVLAAMILLSGTGVAAAAVSSVEFSADTYQKGPQGEISTGRIYLGDNRIRMETERAGRRVVQIIDADRQRTLILFPGQRSYVEQKGAGVETPAASGGGEIDPCQGMADARCRRLGTEKIAGRDAVKWEIRFDRKGKTLQATQWIDAERGMLLKQTFSNGQGSTMKFLGMDTLGGRKEEKWEVVYFQQGQEPRHSYRWFDPELNLIVREEFPGGLVREMRNIRVAPQDPALFQVPLGYRKVQPQ